MENVDTLTPEQVRDRIAQEHGWTFDPSDSSWAIPRGEMRFPGSRYGDHPIPNTLDSAAKCLPEGWKWGIDADGEDEWWYALPPGWDGEEYQTCPRTKDERNDRFKLALLCILAGKADSQKKGTT